MAAPRKLTALLKREGLYLVVLPLLFAFLATLSLLFIASERRANRLLAEYEVDRTAAPLLENELARIFGAGPTTLGMPADIRGFGLYDSAGRALATTTGAPDAIDSRAAPDREHFAFHSAGASIVLVRRLGAFGEASGPGRMMRLRSAPEGAPRFGMQGMMRMQPTAGPAFLYLDLSMPSYFSRERLLKTASVALPLILAAVLLSIGALARRNRHYRERLESQRQLVQLGETARTLSHEIKNPLSAIRLQAALLRKSWTPGAGRPAASGSGEAPLPREIGVIEEEIERLVLLTERMGEFLRDPAGSPQPIEVGGFVRDLLARFEWPVSSPAPTGESCYVRFDPDRLRSVLENIVRNSVESYGEQSPPTKSDGEPLAEVSVHASKSRVEILVADHGSGLEPQAAERIFDPFFTTKARGSGIGLAISKRFVEAAGGSLSLTPGKRCGAEARISLPRIPA